MNSLWGGCLCCVVGVAVWCGAPRATATAFPHPTFLLIAGGSPSDAEESGGIGMATSLSSTL